MSQELQYLRDEINQLTYLQSEHANKTINSVLLVWGGALVVLGLLFSQKINITSKFFYLFIVATVFFISNLILYFSALKYYDRSSAIFNLAAYITVFFEKRPSEKVKVGGKNFHGN